jgi:hypothetical protein
MNTTNIYQTMYLEAGAIKLGHAQVFIAQQAAQGKILHSVHVVREKDGSDVMLMIFEDEEHAKQHGRNNPGIQQSIAAGL